MVARDCGHNLIPIKLELGGKGAAVIFDDVDIPEAADKLAQAITFHTGQVCCDATRWLVQKSIYDDFVNAAVERLKAIQIGHPLGQATQMGPVVSDIQHKRVLGYLEKGTPPVPGLCPRVAPRKSRAAKAATTSSRPCSPARWTTLLHARRFLARWPTTHRSATRAKVSA